jgi:hypothetical protein
MRAPFSTFLLVIAIWAAPALAAQPGVAGMQKKLEHVQANGQLARPDPAPTEFSEDEVNAYMNSGQLQLPAGVKSVKLRGLEGVITGNARVDFDQLKSGRGSANPMLSIFSGVHDIQVDAHAYGKSGRGFVQVDTVALDGVEIPRFVLQLFVQKYLQPKYPEVGLDSQFALPDRVDTATVGRHKLTLIQK